MWKERIMEGVGRRGRQVGKTEADKLVGWLFWA